MSIKTLYTNEKDTNKAVVDLGIKFKKLEMEKTVRMVVFFTTSMHDPQVIGPALKKLFGSADIIGCTTAGEIITGQMLKSSVVCMVFDVDEIEDVNVSLIKNLKSGINVTPTFDSFSKYFGRSLMEFDMGKYVGIILIDGLSVAEEKLMEKIGDLTDIQFIGASAGDDLKFKKTYVFANGEFSSDAAVLALIKPKKGFEIVKTQSFKKLGKDFVATKVIEDKREVVEFNNKPAAQAYAEALGKSVEDAVGQFMTNPVGLMIGGSPYVRSPQQFVGNNMRFFCNIKDGMKLALLESTDIVKDTKEVIEAKKKKLGKISGLINFHCILRTLELEKKKQMEDYGKIFSDFPTIGFSTYGEEYIGHVNQRRNPFFS